MGCFKLDEGRKKHKKVAVDNSLLKSKSKWNLALGIQYCNNFMNQECQNEGVAEDNSSMSRCYSQWLLLNLVNLFYL